MSFTEQIEQLKQDFVDVRKAGYDEGYETGKVEGGNTEEAYARGVADGKQAEYDAFWNGVQQNGNRTDYRLAFSGGSWTSENLKPKYFVTLIPVGSGLNVGEIFSRCGQGNNEVDGMVDVSAACAKFNFSKCTMPNNLFLNACVKNITVDLSSATNLNSTFSQADGGKHENIKLKVSANCVFNLTFAYCSQLTTLEFLEGSVIGRNGLDLHWSPLNKTSIINVINTLSSTTNGLTVTLSLTAVNRAFETSTGANDGSTSAEWLSLIAPKTDTTKQYYWIISLL